MGCGSEALHFPFFPHLAAQPQDAEEAREEVDTAVRRVRGVCTVPSSLLGPSSQFSVSPVSFRVLILLLTGQTGLGLPGSSQSFVLSKVSFLVHSFESQPPSNSSGRILQSERRRAVFSLTLLPSLVSPTVQLFTLDPSFYHNTTVTR